MHSVYIEAICIHVVTFLSALMILVSSLCCRNVMRDVTRLLYLLNKRSSTIEIPPDGMQLLYWSEQILQRYLESQVRHHELLTG